MMSGNAVYNNLGVMAFFQRNSLPFLCPGGIRGYSSLL
jgi:hypothetical protein